jgi:hypothetical protein
MQADSVEEPKYRGMMDCARYEQICLIHLYIFHSLIFYKILRGRGEGTGFMKFSKKICNMALAE